ncbi:MAG: hypothetical protein LUG99_10820 [Lachnospiraceae bacterium]|nr:hypothetical protein [Lachnospiraceae bacterium]
MIKNEDSAYILTRLFGTGYFSYYSKPVIFAAYFLPFIAFGKSRPYLDSEIEEKIHNLKENKHGIVNNYAQQGFGNQAFHEPDINAEYFYQRLCTYDEVKLTYFNVRENVSPDIESPYMKEDLRIVLQKNPLFLKRNVKVPASVKKELLTDLEHGTVKAVLAKLLYYIVSEEHKLPNVNSDTLDSLSRKLGLSPCLNTDLNVVLGFRKDFDEEKSDLYQRLGRAEEVRILCLDGISLFSETAVSMQENGDDKEFEKLLTENRKLSVEIILSKPGCRANVDACNYQVNMPHLKRPKVELSETSIHIITDMMNAIPDNKIALKVTDKSVPYSLFILKFEDSNMDYIKLDLYSPFISDNSERPCMYVFRKMTPDLFRHFEGVFNEMWKDDKYSFFAENL